MPALVWTGIRVSTKKDEIWLLIDYLQLACQISDVTFVAQTETLVSGRSDLLFVYSAESKPRFIPGVLSAAVAYEQNKAQWPAEFSEKVKSFL